MSKILGIDLGTTNSCMAVIEGGQPEVLENKEGARTMPSMVAVKSDGERVAGMVAKRQAVTNPENTIFSVKRLIGRKYTDEDIQKDLKLLPYKVVENGEGTKVKMGDKEHTPQEISAMILQKMKEDAEDKLGEKITDAVITVPAYFDDSQRQATKDAGKIAGLNVKRIINEPTAAALAYGFNKKKNEKIAVYDLGGGTFDISILRLNKGVFEVLATGGDSALGGDDFDLVIAEWLLEQAGLSDSQSPNVLRAAKETAREAKEVLTDNQSASLALGSWHGKLTRTQMNELIAPLIKKTQQACRRALRDAGLQKEDVQDVVMVGGSTRVPAVREQIGEFFGQPPLTELDPDRVVAIGAAIQADILAGNKPDAEMLLLDVIPLSLGLETMGGLVEKVIQRNTTIPITRAQEFTTFKDGQTAMSIHVLQGERETVEQSRSLAKFALRGIPPMVAGAARIRVTFQVDADGLLNVTATEESTGVHAGVEVKPSYGLSDTEIETMLRASMENAREDMEARRLREQQVEADRVLEALDSAMQADGDQLLNEKERGLLLDKRAELYAARHRGDHKTVEAAIKAMESAAEFYVARRMNESVRAAMAGHSVDEFSG